MSLGAVTAAALTDHSARAKGLYVDGVDVAIQPALFPGAGNRMGAPISSVKVQELGPGGVSSMTFQVDDPSNAFAPIDGAEVRFQDLVQDYTIFRGWVQSYKSTPAFGDQGRVWDITAVGPEALLDWAAVTTTALSWAADAMTTTAAVVAQIIAACTGYGPLRSAADDTANDGKSTAAFPTANYEVFPTVVPGSGNAACTISIGTSMRQAILQAMAAIGQIAFPKHSPFTVTTWDTLITVDMAYNLRMWSRTDSLAALKMPDDYTALTVTDTPAAADAAEGLTYDVDATSIPRAVIVTGTGVTVVTPDGSGKVGPVAVLSDATITTAAAATAAGRAYLATTRLGLRGTWRWTDRAAVPAARVGTLVTITDARILGGSPLIAAVFGIDRSFQPSGREDWTVTYGGLPRSAARILRRWTRGNRD